MSCTKPVAVGVVYKSLSLVSSTKPVAVGVVYKSFHRSHGSPGAGGPRGGGHVLPEEPLVSQQVGQPGDEGAEEVSQHPLRLRQHGAHGATAHVLPGARQHLGQASPHQRLWGQADRGSVKDTTDTGRQGVSEGHDRHRQTGGQHLLQASPHQRL